MAGRPVLAFAAAAFAAAANAGPPGRTSPYVGGASRMAAQSGGATVEVKASRRGFQPSSLTLRRGETAHLVLTSSDGEHCFAVDALRIEKRIVPGRPTRFDLAVDRTGIFAFYCCREAGEAAERERGQLTVVD